MFVATVLAAGHVIADTAPPAVSSTTKPVSKVPTATQVEKASLWDISSTARLSFGWRENVTVSSIRSINRTFWRTEADTLVLRPIGKQWRFISFLSGDVLRYFNPPGTVSGEQQWAADVQARWQPSPRWLTTFKTVGFYEDTFIDPSQSEGEQLPATAVRFLGVYGELDQRIVLGHGVAIVPSFQLKRIAYRRGYPGDYNESRPGLTIEWSPANAFSLSATAYDHVRHYRYLHPASPGRPIRNRLLSLHQPEAQVTATTRFGHRTKWRISSTFGVLRNRDRANGFLDYDQKRAELEVGVERGSWRVRLSGDARRQNYRTQVVGFGIVQTPRIADIFDLSGRIEHDLSDKWMVFAQERWERNRSNINDDPLFRFSYRTNTALIGIQRSF